MQVSKYIILLKDYEQQMDVYYIVQFEQRKVVQSNCVRLIPEWAGLIGVKRFLQPASQR